METLKFRPNVAAIIQDAAGLVLICERADHPGSWQFPQGGIDPGETPEVALPRELREEISLEPTQYVVEAQRGPYRYRFPDGVKKWGFDGQEQTYFLLRLTALPGVVNFATAHAEFRAVRWVRPEDFPLAALLVTKHTVYRDVLRDFFGVEIA